MPPASAGDTTLAAPPLPLSTPRSLELSREFTGLATLDNLAEAIRGAVPVKAEENVAAALEGAQSVACCPRGGRSEARQCQCLKQDVLHGVAAGSSRESPTTAIETGTWKFLEPRYEDKLPPCAQACPAGNDISKAIALLAAGDMAAQRGCCARVIRCRQPLAGSAPILVSASATASRWAGQLPSTCWSVSWAMFHWEVIIAAADRLRRPATRLRSSGRDRRASPPPIRWRCWVTKSKSSTTNRGPEDTCARAFPIIGFPSEFSTEEIALVEQAG